MLGLANGVKNTKRKAMFYQKGADVVKDKSKLWAIEKNWNNYALRNAFVDNYLRMQTEWGDGNPSWDTNDQSMIKLTLRGLSFPLRTLVH